MNDRARELFIQGQDLNDAGDHRSALKKYEAALSLIDSWDTEYRDALSEIIEDTKKLIMYAPY